jgi:hypothetical protein
VRVTVRRFLLAIAFLADLLSFCIVPLARLSEYGRVRGEMQDSIYGLQYRVPQGVNPATWECAWGWTLNAYGNICFSEEHVHIDEMYRLRAELLPKLRGPGGLQTLAWVWDRLAQTGPHGRRYVELHRPSFLNCFAPGTIPTTSPSPPSGSVGPPSNQ